MWPTHTSAAVSRTLCARFSHHRVDGMTIVFLVFFCLKNSNYDTHYKYICTRTTLLHTRAHQHTVITSLFPWYILDQFFLFVCVLPAFVAVICVFFLAACRSSVCRLPPGTRPNRVGSWLLDSSKNINYLSAQQSASSFLLQFLYSDFGWILMLVYTFSHNLYDICKIHTARRRLTRFLALPTWFQTR